MEYLITIFLLGVIVTFIVIVGLARAAEFAHAESAEHLELDSLPEDLSGSGPVMRPAQPGDDRGRRAALS